VEQQRPMTKLDSTGAASANEQLLTFIVDGEEYGVDILRVQEIRSWSNPMPIPNTPHYIKGVINIRGDVVAIADLRERLGLPRLDYGATTVVVVLRVGGGSHDRERVMGVIVDAMSDVTTVPQAAIKAPPAFKSTHEGSVAKGIVTLDNKMITILDVDRIFDVPSASLTPTA
jgi:purine-binding chemotaxis protein CheW